MNLQIDTMLGGQLDNMTGNTYSAVDGADAQLIGDSHDGER